MLKVYRLISVLVVVTLMIAMLPATVSAASISAAYAESSTRILITLPQPVTSTSAFRLKDFAAGTDLDVSMSLSNFNKTINMTLKSGTIDPRKVYQIYTTDGSFKDYTVKMRRILDSYYDNRKMGVKYTKESSTFDVWAPTAKNVQVAIYDDRSTTTFTKYDMIRNSQGTWTGTINGDLAGKYYTYRLTFATADSAGERVVHSVDPYSIAIAANNSRSAIVDLAATNPPGFDPTDRPKTVNYPTDHIIYEMHIRDFSVNSDSGMKDKGKFLTFTHSGTHVKGITESLSSGLDHLKELGVTTVHLMPTFDIKSVDNGMSYSWGYDPLNFNVPEPYYSTTPNDPTVAIREFKQMIKTFHDNGLRVVIDVVYNHTNGTTTPFGTVVPDDYFYRTWDNGSLSNATGCGNEIATERPMVRKYILDSVMYWAQEYGVDGFRFDLMGAIDTYTMKDLATALHNKVDKTILVYGEPWLVGSTPLAGSDQTTKGKQRNNGFAVFNDDFRRAIKGNNDDDSKGFAQGGGQEGNVAVGVRGSITSFASSPAESINYVTAHDNLNLWDKILYSSTSAADLNNTSKYGMLYGQINNGSYNKQNYSTLTAAVSAANPYYNIDTNNPMSSNKVRMAILANGIVLTSQGIPFFVSGDEFLRTKYGDRNSYASGDIINQLRWTNKQKFKAVNDYYIGLIKLRREHPAFRMPTASMVNSNLKVIQASSNIVKFQLQNYANNDTWRNILVIYNANSTPLSADRESGGTVVSLPPGTWNVVVDDQKAGTTKLREVSGSVRMNSFSMMVLYDKAKETTMPTIPDEPFPVIPDNATGILADDIEYDCAMIRDAESGKTSLENTQLPSANPLGKWVTTGGVMESNILVEPNGTDKKVEMAADNEANHGKALHLTQTSANTAKIGAEFDFYNPLTPSDLNKNITIVSKIKTGGNNFILSMVGKKKKSDGSQSNISIVDVGASYNTLLDGGSQKAVGLQAYDGRNGWQIGLIELQPIYYYIKISINFADNTYTIGIGWDYDSITLIPNPKLLSTVSWPLRNIGEDDSCLGLSAIHLRCEKQNDEVWLDSINVYEEPAQPLRFDDIQTKILDSDGSVCINANQLPLTASTIELVAQSPINQSTLLPSSFLLKSSSGENIQLNSQDILYNPLTQTIDINISGKMAVNTTYTLIVSGLKGLSGAEMSPEQYEFSFATMDDAPYNTLVYYNDFSAETVGEMPANNENASWSNASSIGTGGSTSIKVATVSDGNVLEIKSSSGNTSNKTQAIAKLTFSEPLKDKFVVIEAKVKKGASSDGIFMNIPNFYSSDGINGGGIAISKDGSTGGSNNISLNYFKDVAAVKTSWNAPLGDSVQILSADTQWHDVKLIVNLWSKNIAALVDEVLIAKNIPFRDSSISDIKYITYVVETSASNKPGTLYIKEIKVMRGNIPRGNDDFMQLELESKKAESAVLGNAVISVTFNQGTDINCFDYAKGYSLKDVKDNILLYNKLAGPGDAIPSEDYTAEYDRFTNTYTIMSNNQTSGFAPGVYVLRFINIKNAYGDAVLTDEYEFEISNDWTKSPVVFFVSADHTGMVTELKSFENKTIYARAYLMRLTRPSSDATLVLALFDEYGVLKKISVKSGTSLSSSDVLDCEIKLTEIDGCTLRAYIFKDLNTMAPLIQDKIMLRCN